MSLIELDGREDTHTDLQRVVVHTSSPRVNTYLRAPQRMLFSHLPHFYEPAWLA